MKASKRSRIDPFRVMDIFNQANALERQGHDIIHMEAGQPGTPAPESVLEAAKYALSTDKIGYKPLGLPQLRERIARYYGDVHGLDIAPSRIIITTGSSAGFILSFLALFDSGARIGLGAPYYPAYPNLLRVLGCDPVIIPTGPDSNYQLTAEHVTNSINGCTPIELDGLIVASPANPTGSMLLKDELEALVHLCGEQRITLISDEIYHGITYKHTAHTALEFGSDVIVVNSFSKYYSMTGWRIGWLVVPEDMGRSFHRLDQNLYISAPAISQFAALAAMDARAELDEYVSVYARNRDLLLKELPKAGLKKFAPADGAFYLYADISHITDDSESFCNRMLNEIGVAATPGTDFDAGTRTSYVRFSYAGSHREMASSADRLKKWLAP